MNIKANEGKLIANRVFSYLGEEEWSDYERPEEALQDMEDEGDLEVGNIFLTGGKNTPNPIRYMISANEILEKYEESIDCEHGCEYTDGNTGSDKVTDEAKKELNDFLNQWTTKHLHITFWEIDHEEEIAVTQEMIDAFHANKPIPLPGFKLGGSHE